MLFVLDIDGTVANAESRFKEAGAEPSRNNRKRYSAWVNAIQNSKSLMKDQPVAGMAHLAHAMRKQGRLIYLTSREEKWRQVTLEWLRYHEFPEGRLVMRPNGNWADTADFKHIAVEFYKYSDDEAVVFVDDDEHGTIEKMCKVNGYTFLKARSGGQK